jgi:hypothetical protein
VNLSINRFKDSAMRLIHTLGRSFQESLTALEERVIEARARACRQSIDGFISRYHNADGLPSSIGAQEISTGTDCLSGELKQSLQVLMDDCAVLCFDIDKEVLAEALSSDCIRIMKEDPHHALLYWNHNLRFPHQLEKCRIRNLSRLPADVIFEDLRFISAKILRK